MAALEKIERVEVGGPDLVEWSVASRPVQGQTICGDLHLVSPTDQATLLAVIDGLGHGREAAAAAQAVVDILRAHAHESPISLVKRCHDALADTRGAVMTVATLRGTDNTLTWLGVGNVEGRLLRADGRASHPCETLLLRGGLVGYQLPALYASVIPVAPGDLLILATDGIEPGFDDQVHLNEAPARIAQSILKRHIKGSDDALVLVARYVGRAHE